MTTTTIHAPTRLETIATRHSHRWLRDAVFAACVALIAAVSVITVSTASHAARAPQVEPASHVAQR